MIINDNQWWSLISHEVTWWYIFFHTGIPAMSMISPGVSWWDIFLVQVFMQFLWYLKEISWWDISVVEVIQILQVIQVVQVVQVKQLIQVMQVGLAHLWPDIRVILDSFPLHISCYLCLNCFTLPRIITSPYPLSSVLFVRSQYVFVPFKNLFRCLAVYLYQSGSSVQNMSSSIFVCPINIFLWLTKILQRPENK